MIMVIIAGLIVVAGYGLAYWGLCLIKGKNVTIVQMFNPFGNYAQFSGPFSKWPGIPATQVMPGGAPGSSAPASGTTPRKPSPGGLTPPGNAPCPPGWIKVFGKCIPVSPI
jgi:hypothetical protein